MISTAEGLLPIESPQVGLLTWYTPAGAVVAMATSWLGVISGVPPELRAGCCGQQEFAPGTDFAVNIPASMDVPILRQLLPQVAQSHPQVISAGIALMTARSVHAPLLAGCALQIECARGRVLHGDWVPQLAGDVVLLHRGGRSLDPGACCDFCALHPLRAHPPA